MYDEPEGLKNRIGQLSNEELKRMVNIEPEQYRQEALDYAHEEMHKRGLKIEPVSYEVPAREDEEGANADSGYLGPEAETAQEVSPSSSVEFKIFRGNLASWEELFSEAADYATQIGPMNLIGISHSEDDNEGVVTVWYWA